jgi:hypothetical protein
MLHFCTIGINFSRYPADEVLLTFGAAAVFANYRLMSRMVGRGDLAILGAAFDALVRHFIWRP